MQSEGAYGTGSESLRTRKAERTIEDNMSLSQITTTVRLFYFVLSHWCDNVVPGIKRCELSGQNISCELFSSGNMTELQKELLQFKKEQVGNAISVALYNIHSLKETFRPRYAQPVCDLRTNLTFATSEESMMRFRDLFNHSFDNFDGYSTAHPSSSVQRIYEEAYMMSIVGSSGLDGLPSTFTHPKLPTNSNLNETTVRLTLTQVNKPHNFSILIKAASYIASECHTRDFANARRDIVVQQIRNEGFRVDGLGRCMHSKSSTPEGGIVLHHAPNNSTLNAIYKRKVIAKYLFHLAFENSIEDGYVTEKPFDALISGTVPIYLGDAIHLKRLLPHPKAAIFVADYNGNITTLTKYLSFLSNNETAYEEHRVWWNNFSLESHTYS